MNVVLVHGFLNRDAILRKLARHLTSVGHKCFVPSLRPCDARGGLPELAGQLGRFIDANLPGGARFALIGFSMGALISRYYVQELGGSQRLEAFFSICGPHGGTWSAYTYPSEGVRQMRPGSHFLRGLDASAERVAGIPVVCYWNPYDLMVRPLASARWKQATEHVRIACPVHSWMLFDRRLHRDIERHLSALTPLVR